MTEPSYISYAENDPVFSYHITKNPLFSNIEKEGCDNASYMPFLLTPVLSKTVNIKNLFPTLEEGIKYLDTINANELATLYYNANKKLKKLKLNPLNLFKANNEQAKLRQIIENINLLHKDKETGKVDDILFFAIKNNISNSEKIRSVEIWIHDEITDNPWYLNTSGGGTIIQEVIPNIKGYYAESVIEGTTTKVYHYPYYSFFINEKENFIALHRSNGKIKREGVLDSYSTTQVLYKNKTYLLNALELEKNKLKQRIEKINENLGELNG